MQTAPECDGGIPCSVNILTFNSASTVRRTLESVHRFAEVVVLDGGSTDDTLAIAEEFGCKIVAQNPEFLDDEGRVLDFSGVRNQNVAASSQSWIFRIDSDDWATEQLVDEISAVCRTDDARPAYRVAAKYELDGEILDCAAAYPMYFVRLFRRDVAGHSGAVNENVTIEGEPGTLDGAFVIPVQPLSAILRKWQYYLRVERHEVAGMAPEDRSHRVREARSNVRWFTERWRASRSNCSGRRLPLRYELARIAHLSYRYVRLNTIARFENGRERRSSSVNTERS